MKIQPLADRIMVKVLEAKEVTKGGIVLPDSAKEKPQEAEVIAVGKGKVSDEGKTIAPEVKAGEGIIRKIFRHRDNGGRQGIPDIKRGRHPRDSKIR